MITKALGGLLEPINQVTNVLIFNPNSFDVFSKRTQARQKRKTERNGRIEQESDVKGSGHPEALEGMHVNMVDQFVYLNVLLCLTFSLLIDTTFSLGTLNLL